MAHRYNLGENLGTREDSGYDGIPETEFTIPSSGIEDVDIAVFDLFDKELNLMTGDDENGYKKTPVIFASGEKWALLKTGKALRDKNGILILPLITITRNGFSQSDITQRGINQFTGNIKITRKLSPQDSDYQNLINKSLLQNQENVVSNSIIDNNSPTLSLNRKDNIFEVISIPSPQFFQATYEITFWCQYMTQMNMLTERLFSSLLPHGNSFRLDARNGYWFVGTIDGGQINYDTNFSDMSSDERYIKSSFTMNVPGYILAPQNPGEPIAVRKQVFAPSSISFESENIQEDLNNPNISEEENIIDINDPTYPMKTRKSIGESQTFDGTTNLNNKTYVSIQATNEIDNKNGGKYLRKKNKNFIRIIDDKTGKFNLLEIIE